MNIPWLEIRYVVGVTKITFGGLSRCQWVSSTDIDDLLRFPFCRVRLFGTLFAFFSESNQLEIALVASGTVAARSELTCSRLERNAPPLGGVLPSLSAVARARDFESSPFAAAGGSFGHASSSDLIAS